MSDDTPKTRECSLCKRPIKEDNTLGIWREEYVHIACALRAMQLESLEEATKKLWRND